MTNRIKAYRKQKELTQKQVASTLDVAEKTISRIENKTCTPNVSLALGMARLYSTTVEILFGEE